MKKITVFALVTVCCINILGGIFDVYAAPELSAQHACLIEAESGRVIFEKDAHTPHAMASTTKIMTALMAIEADCMDDVVTVSRKATLEEGSSIYLCEGDQMLMSDMIYGLMLNSGNDAAVAIAEHISGSVDKFAEDMTAKAKECGAYNTEFKNPNGLDAKGHYTTAYDLAIISRKAMQNETFAKIVATKKGTIMPINRGEKTYLSNHNRLLSMYEGVNGIKTGYTSATGRCLVSSAERDGMKFIAVTLNAPDDWNDHIKLLDYAFGSCEKKTVVEAGSIVKTAKTADGLAYSAVTAGEYAATVPKGESAEADISVKIADRLKSPVNKGEKIGKLDISYRGDVIESIDLVADHDVGQISGRSKNFLDCFLVIVHNWFMTVG